ncbi:MAG: glycoside hydrolase N-terminal domain-containing protein [Planctomycetia bacterium]|nr:glycoside hydrolase N-terminal domain-containing protein [Planctomycetia bacterium]
MNHVARMIPLLLTTLLLCLSTASAAEPLDAPNPASDLELAAPIDRWDEAIPLGGGLLGGLVWGDGNPLRLSLDRGDLWDLRTPEPLLRKDWTYATIRKGVAEKNQAALGELFDKPYNDFAYPTKIPAGRIELVLGPGRKVESFHLDLRRAVARAKLAGGGAVDVFFSATEPVAMLRVEGPAADWRIVMPTSLKTLGYADAEIGREGETAWALQTASGGLKYAVVATSRRVGDATEIAVTVTSSGDDPDPVALGRRRASAALAKGYEAVLAPHVSWWKEFWSASAVSLPDAAIQRHYDLVQYFYGSASRRGAPPIPLQGVWTADEGTLPPWKGDYHHDLNTQLTYWAYLASGRFAEGECFLDFMWNLLPEHRRFARKFYAAPGAAVPGVMTLDGKAMGGWGQYSLSPIQGAWIAQAFYWHWRYTMDPEFLNQRAYPYGAEIAECLVALLEPGPDGKLNLPLSTSPEIHDNRLESWLTPNSNNDLALLRWLFAALAEMADARQDTAAATRWRGVLGRLDDLAIEGTDGALRLSPNESLAESHRHHAHLMAIHPLGILTVEGTPRDRKIIEASLAQIDRLGTKAWCGYSFSWMACLGARAGQPDRALSNLKLFVDAFISRNGFHLNGDQTGRGYSNFTYRPFTLEGNFAAGQAVHEMLLQSWGNTVRVFPAVPGQWADVAYRDLRAEGAFAVSARREAGKTAWVKVRSERGGQLRLRDPFAGAAASWNRDDVKKVGDDYVSTLAAGEVLEGHPAP